MIKAVLSQGRVNEQSIFESNSINKSVFEPKFIEFSNNFWVKFDWIHFWAKIDWMLKEFCIRFDWMIENFLIGMWLLDQSTLDWNSIRRKSLIDKSVFESNSIERTKHKFVECLKYFWVKFKWMINKFFSEIRSNNQSILTENLYNVQSIFECGSIDQITFQWNSIEWTKHFVKHRVKICWII